MRMAAEPPASAPNPAIIPFDADQKAKYIEFRSEGAERKTRLTDVRLYPETTNPPRRCKSGMNKYTETGCAVVKIQKKGSSAAVPAVNIIMGLFPN